MSKKTFISMIILAILLAACGAKATNKAMPVEMPAMAPGLGYQEKSGGGDFIVTEEESLPRDSVLNNVTSDTAIERMVIKNADLSIVVKDPSKTMDEIAKMAEEMDGFVVTSNLYQRTLSGGLKVNQASITIRVPAERLDEAIQKIKEGAGEVLRENRSGQDVTREYTDLQSRLRNLEAAEKQLMQIMENATRTEDVLRVYNELVNVREQIEVIKGQMQYYEQAAALSAINVDITADEAVQPIVIGGWKPQGTAKKAIQTLIKTLQQLADLGIWTGLCVLPVGILLGVPLYFIIRAVLRSRKKRKAEKVENAGQKTEE